MNYIIVLFILFSFKTSPINVAKTIVDSEIIVVVECLGAVEEIEIVSFRIKKIVKGNIESQCIDIHPALLDDLIPVCVVFGEYDWSSKKHELFTLYIKEGKTHYEMGYDSSISTIVRMIEKLGNKQYRFAKRIAKKGTKREIQLLSQFLVIENEVSLFDKVQKTELQILMLKRKLNLAVPFAETNVYRELWESKDLEIEEALITNLVGSEKREKHEILLNIPWIENSKMKQALQIIYQNKNEDKFIRERALEKAQY